MLVVDKALPAGSSVNQLSNQMDRAPEPDAARGVRGQAGARNDAVLPERQTQGKLGSAPLPGQGVELTILMPCLNEARTLPICIAKARSFLNRLGVVGEVLVSDNGSTDGSREVACQHGARVIS